MGSPYFSVVCIFNKPELLEKDLAASLRQQSFSDWELVTLDTRAEGFTAAAPALNEACSRAKGEVLIVAHQDMIFTQPDSLEQLAQECRQVFDKGFGLLGAAGAYPDGENYNPMENSQDRSPSPVPVMTVDECILVMPRQVKERFQFSDLGCTWHAYGVELSMQLRQAGYLVGVFHAPVWHDWGKGEARGQTTDWNYFCTMGRLCWRWRHQAQAVATTCGRWETGWGYRKVLAKRMPGAVLEEIRKHIPKGLRAWVRKVRGRKQQ